jgi:drug/metabolite transporter (DMT)-like permease
MLYFAIFALIPVTYLFINRNVIHRERRRERWIDASVAAVWGGVYAVLLGSVFGLPGVVAGLTIGVYSFLR